MSSHFDSSSCRMGDASDSRQFSPNEGHISFRKNDERKVMLWAGVLLLNYRTGLVGVNKILSTFMPYLGAEANNFIAVCTT